MDQPAGGTLGSGVDPRALAAGVGEHFGLRGARPVSPRPVSRGAMGAIWSVAAAGRRYAVKELFWPAGESAVRREVAFRDAAVAAGVPAPECIAGRDGHYLWRVPAHLGGRLVRLYTWADGTPARVGQPATAPGLGTLLGRLHALRRAQAGAPHPWYDTAPDIEEFRGLAAAGAAAGMAWAPPLTARLAEIEALAGLVVPPPVERLVTCHLDVSPANVLVNGSGMTLLDWDDVGPGEPARELVSVLLRWYRTPAGLDRAAAGDAFLAYQAAGGPARPADPGCFAMYLATWLNHVATQARLSLDTGAVGEHARFSVTEVVDALATMPDQATMDVVLRVCRG